MPGIVGPRRLFDHLWPGQHVSGHGEPVARDLTAPLDALDPGVGGDIAFGVDQVQLAMLAARVGEGEHAHHVGRRVALREQRQPAGSIQRIDQRLRRQCADAAMCMRA